MAVANMVTVLQATDEAALREFEEGLARSIRQYKAGEVETFDDIDEFLRTLVE